MISEYSYDVITKVIDLFQQSRIVTLNIEDCNEQALIDYTTTEDYDASERLAISHTLRNSLGTRLYVSNLLNQYIEKKSLDEVTKFFATFNAYGVKQCKFESSYQFSGKPFSQKTNTEMLKKGLEQIDRAIVNMGVSDQKTELYRREGSGKSKKYVALTMQEVAEKLRKELEM